MKRKPAFLLGFFALSSQVLLMREFAAHFYGNEVVFGVLLAAWMLWTGLGSILAARIRFTDRRFVYAYSAAILALPLILAAVRLSRFLLGLLPGEASGLAPAALFALALTSLICLPLGCLFVFNTRASQGRLAHVYLWEALGSTAAGLLMYFLLIPRLTNWQAAALLGGSASLALFLWVSPGRHRLVLFLSLAVMTALWITDFPSQRLYWKPYDLIESRDSLYGKLQMLRDAEQVSLYSNSAPVYSSPDPGAAEEAVHFALLQRPHAQTVLLIGGGVGGDLTQLLKYPVTQIDYVESDPEIIRFSRRHLPEAEARSLDAARVRVIHADGRSFLRGASSYDVIIVDLPDPATAQLNRFYTLEFFRLVKQHLTPGGLFSFRVTSAENYISPELQGFLASLYATLQTAFAEVAVVPGSTNIFLASRTLEPLEHEAMSRRIESLQIETQYVNPAMLSDRLSPLRQQQLAYALQAGQPRLNRDLYPISYLSYFYSAVLWSVQFRGLESRLFSTLAGLDRSWLLDVPLAFFLLTLLALGVRGRRPVFLLIPDHTRLALSQPGPALQRLHAGAIPRGSARDAAPNLPVHPYHPPPGPVLPPAARAAAGCGGRSPSPVFHPLPDGPGISGRGPVRHGQPAFPRAEGELRDRIRTGPHGLLPGGSRHLVHPHPHRRPGPADTVPAARQLLLSAVSSVGLAQGVKEGFRPGIVPSHNWGL
jgi:spermidine synthase